MYQFVYDSLNHTLEDYSVDELITEVEDYYPELLESYTEIKVKYVGAWQLWDCPSFSPLPRWCPILTSVQSKFNGKPLQRLSPTPTPGVWVLPQRGSGVGHLPQSRWWIRLRWGAWPLRQPYWRLRRSVSVPVTIDGVSTNHPIPLPLLYIRRVKARHLCSWTLKTVRALLMGSSSHSPRVGFKSLGSLAVSPPIRYDAVTNSVCYGVRSPLALACPLAGSAIGQSVRTNCTGSLPCDTHRTGLQLVAESPRHPIIKTFTTNTDAQHWSLPFRGWRSWRSHSRRALRPWRGECRNGRRLCYPEPHRWQPLIRILSYAAAFGAGVLVANDDVRNGARVGAANLLNETSAIVRPDDRNTNGTGFDLQRMGKLWDLERCPLDRQRWGSLPPRPSLLRLAARGSHS